MGINLWMVFEAVAAEREALENSLEDHIEKLESEPGVEITESETDDISEVENPHPGLEKGYSQVSEVIVEVENYAKAMEVVINYGPTYVQVEGPEDYQLTLKESQEALQTVAETVQQYAQMGVGGVLISRVNEEDE